MKIKKDSIINLYEYFEDFSNEISGLNYNFTIDAKKFYFNKDFNFTILDLKLLFSDEELHFLQPVKGFIKEISFLKMKDDINDGLKNCGHDLGFDKGKFGHEVIKEIHEIRKVKFWNILNNLVNLPPFKVFQHFPDDGSLFENKGYWTLAYCLLNLNKQGLWIDISAGD